jgi:hypothetical protein
MRSSAMSFTAQLHRNSKAFEATNTARQLQDDASREYTAGESMWGSRGGGRRRGSNDGGGRGC